MVSFCHSKNKYNTCYFFESIKKAHYCINMTFFVKVFTLHCFRVNINVCKILSENDQHFFWVKYNPVICSGRGQCLAVCVPLTWKCSSSSPLIWVSVWMRALAVSCSDSVFRRVCIAVISTRVLWLIWWPISYHSSEPGDSTMTTILQPANHSPASVTGNGSLGDFQSAGGVEWVDESHHLNLQQDTHWEWVRVSFMPL